MLKFIWKLTENGGRSVKRFFSALICLLFLFPASAFAAAEAEGAEIFVISVGKGDAILIRTDGKAYLIDTAKDAKWGCVQSALNELGITRLDGVFVTHTDSDHVGGLAPLAASDIEVGAWYASGFCAEYKKETKHPVYKAAQARGQEVTWLYAGDEVDGIFSVLAPQTLIEDNEDDNSLVMTLKTAYGNALLCGDMEFEEERLLLMSGADVKCRVLKAANHGDDDTLSNAMVIAASPEIAVISTDPYEKPGTPDPVVLSRLENLGAQVFCTYEADMGVRVTLNADGARAEYVNYSEVPPMREDIVLVSVDAQADTVVIANKAGESTDISGWYLISDKGGEMMVFPKGTVLAPGRTMVVGTRTTKTAFDLLWDDKNVIHNSKTDVITLYDPMGRAAQQMSNGF